MKKESFNKFKHTTEPFIIDRERDSFGTIIYRVQLADGKIKILIFDEGSHTDAVYAFRELGITNFS